MRIVHVADSFAPDVGGIERQVETLARRQVSEGHDVTVITAVNEPADLPLDVRRAASGRWLTVAFPWRNYRMVAEVLDSGRIDVVHAHFSVVSPLGVYVTRAASRRGIPVAVTVHSLWWKVAIATRITAVPFGPGRIRAAWSGVSSVAAGHVKRTLRRVGPISVVPNLVDTRWWHRDEWAERQGGDEVRIVLVGRLKKRKHVGEFIEVLGRARREVAADVRVSVSIVGEGPRRADLQRQIADLGLGDWVTLLGQRPPDEIRALLHSADLFVASSRQESFGIAALEARAAGLPVLGYRSSGLRDFIVDGTEGLLVADADEMVRAVTTLLSRPEELDKLRRATLGAPPSVTSEDAMTAVEDLYRRAQAMHPTRRVSAVH